MYSFLKMILTDEPLPNQTRADEDKEKNNEDHKPKVSCVLWPKRDKNRNVQTAETPSSDFRPSVGIISKL